VLSPRPRIGDLQERVGWFATYGVRECWLVHQIDRYVAVLALADGRIVERRLFDEESRIRSAVLPAFDASLARIAPAPGLGRFGTP
jgi:Uma2 family endonuclease